MGDLFCLSIVYIFVYMRKLHFALSLFSLVLKLSGQHLCSVNNLWVNGNFEDTSMSCYYFNPANKLSNQNSPWKGYSLFRWQPKSKVQPRFLNEATTDHTTGTNNGHYLYIDPRNLSGYKYQFYQTFKIQKSTWYNFSLWYCSMNMPQNPGATIRLTVNNKVVAADINIPNINNSWVQLQGAWFSGSDTTAIAALETLNAQIHGNDLAVDDIAFGNGLLSADAGPDQTFCETDSAKLHAITWSQLGSRCRSYEYEWQPSANIAGSNRNETVKLKHPISAGSYSLTVKDLNGNICKDTIKVILAKALNPKLQVDTNICPGQSLDINIPTNLSGEFKWQDGSTLNSRIINSSGNYIIYYSNACNQLNDTFKIAIDSLPLVSLGNDTILCNTSQFIVSIPKKSFNLIWENGSTDSFRILTQNTTLCLKTWNHCKVIGDTQIVRFEKTPDNLTPPDFQYCDSLSYWVKIDSLWSGKCIWWDGSKQINRFFTKEGTFKIRYTSSCGTFDDSIKLISRSIPKFNLGNDTAICMNGQFKIYAPPSYQYEWNTGSNTQGVFVKSTGKYYVTILNQYGCSTSDTIEIAALPNLSDIPLPNAFTPDDNGLNDFFPVKKFNQNVTLSIYNRWGEKIFESNRNNGWDGNYLNKPCPEGVYTWLLCYSDCDGFRKFQRGNITLLR